ncbi:guanine nucleotide-releasing factor 2 isoform X1 [Glossina fuscipes]|uniref:CRK SH3-binding GNRP n=1 Tax=Glossina fuscipes TaxID=7396 RepID=A0A9C5YUV0_9MUSC|nr:guanine nucleotide-releasing factor 2 isoform X1 [Glossina fuscipes]
MMQKDSVISSPSTPNSSLSSQTNLSTPITSNPIQQATSTPLNNTNSYTAAVLGHKNSLRGTKLAKRARSFKDDLFEKISLMRTPTNTLGRSHSPQSPRNKNKQPPTAEEVAKSSQSLETHVKDISNALKYFRDVILKKKLEVLPGNGTVILETIASMFSVIQSYMLNENSATLLSATQQVYQSLGKLIKLCDEVMLSEDSEECASLSSENVKEIVDLLEDAVRNLATLAQLKLKEKEEMAFQYDNVPMDTQMSTNTIVSVLTAQNLLVRPPVEIAGQRTSLPDITLTPKERDSLEKTTSNPMRVSYSTESILRDTSPPPKPPLPHRSSNPPPLPPKRNSQPLSQPYEGSLNSDLDNSNDYPLGVDHLSVRSRSPDENSSQCSLDSAMNHSREDEECRLHSRDYNLLTDEFKNLTEADGDADNKLQQQQKIQLQEEQLNKTIGTYVDVALTTRASLDVADEDVVNIEINRDKAELRKTANHRHSNESGFVSINSFRTSSQSYSKRSSDFSFQSSTKSSNSSTEIAILAGDNSINEEYLQQQQQQQAKTIASTKSTVCISNTSSFVESSLMKIQQQQVEEHLTFSPAHYIDAEKLLIDQFHNSLSTLKQTNSLDITTGSVTLAQHDEDLMPPALPPKTSKLSKDRQPSMYDNFDAIDNINGSVQELPELRQHHQHRVYQWQTKHTSLIEPRRCLDLPAGSCNALTDGQNEQPPPLPMKKKHMFQSVAFSVLAYMEICSASTRSVEQHRHTMHAYNLNRNITHSQTMNIVPLAKEEFLTPEMETPPALPPKNYKQWKTNTIVTTPTIITTPPPSPKPKIADHMRILSCQAGNEIMSTVCEELTDQCEDEAGLVVHSNELGNDYETSMHQGENNTSQTILSSIFENATSTSNGDFGNEVEEMVTYNNNNRFDEIRKSPLAAEEINHLPNIIEEVDITPYLIFKKETEDGPEIKGGYIDALIVHASRVQKVTDNAFSEAFITTFRTFIPPVDVIEKLTHRYTVFFCQHNDQKQKAAKETFSLLVRVVNDLTSTDLTGPLLTLLVEFVYQLVCAGQLYLAKLLRNKIVEKVTLYKELRLPLFPNNDMFFTVTNQPSLLDLKSLEIAEQMTLLDAELFQKIEIPEVLLFAKEQCEEKSPNLNKFTEHFNKMSYWARSKILTLTCAKEREKHVIKFIKIMKHLRKMNNYNSYLALLSALDSAPIRRLEWHKTITDGLKEYCTLIDSSSSFRAYRQALAETQPPCIPYIGLVLQDLTFVHVGNPDYLKDGVINFSKRWQQYNIIDNMKRFKKCSYPFRRNERIIRFFENFENFLGEEQMWEISEAIKPRGKRTVVPN